MSENSRSGPRPRIETLSDLTFGLALSIGAFSLLSKLPANLNDVASDIIAFGFSFVVLIFVWLRYTSIMSVLPIETRTTMFLNVAMLFLVSIEPYLFNLVSLFGHEVGNQLVDYASVLYSLDMAGLMAILAFFTHELTVEEKKLIASESLHKYKQIRNSLIVTVGLFLFTVIPQFWTWRIQNIPLRFFLWFAPLAVFWVRRSSEDLRKRVPP